MKIDNINNISNYSAVSSDKTAKRPTVKEGKAPSSDRVEIGARPSAEDAGLKIRDNILKTEKQSISSERLEAIKNRVSLGEYRVDTKDIVKSIM
jgi:Anti-sigma-28 factor, FlgM.